VSVLITDSACCEERDQGLPQLSPTIKLLLQVREFLFSHLFGPSRDLAANSMGPLSLHSVAPNFFKSTARITYSIGLDKLLLFFQDWRCLGVCLFGFVIFTHFLQIYLTAAKIS
jgi:hypothetical protein